MDELIRGYATVLLGAGASHEAGVPLTSEMTQRMVEAFEVTRFRSTYKALIFVCGTMMAYDSRGGTSPWTGLDIERLFSAVELLSDRSSLEVSPFVASWDPYVESIGRPDPDPFLDNRLVDGVKDAMGTGRGRGNGRRLRDALLKAIRAETGSAGGGRVFTNLRDEMIMKLRQLLYVEPTVVGYLAPLVELSRAQGGLAIATLNYDLTVEVMAAGLGESVHTGILEWSQSGEWGWPSDGIRLLKLHGSIDWCRETGRLGPGFLPRETVVTTADPHNDSREPMVVFGQRGKLRSEGPFLGLLRQFETELERAQTLIVVGYSFRDDHVNNAIREWVNASLERRVVVIDPAFPTRGGSGQYPAFREAMLSALTVDPIMGDQGYPDRLFVIRETAGAGLLTLCSEKSDPPPNAAEA